MQSGCVIFQAVRCQFLTERVKFCPVLAELICSRRQVRVLTLCRWPNSTFDPKIIEYRFPELRNLTLMDSEVTRLKAFSSDLKELKVVVSLSGVWSDLQLLLMFCLKK